MPIVKFTTLISMNCVDEDTGFVIAEKFPALSSWNETCNLEMILLGLSREMCNISNFTCIQPAEDADFPDIPLN